MSFLFKEVEALKKSGAKEVNGVRMEEYEKLIEKLKQTVEEYETHFEARAQEKVKSLSDPNFQKKDLMNDYASDLLELEDAEDSAEIDSLEGTIECSLDWNRATKSPMGMPPSESPETQSKAAEASEEEDQTGMLLVGKLDIIDKYDFLKVNIFL